ncbi:MAG: N-acetylmuramoyl-L-alanine amidase [Candidatus Hydrogenedentota bacterium]
MPHSFLHTLSVALLVAVLGATHAAHAQTQPYKTTLEGRELTVEPLIYYADGQPYVSLLEIVKALGGSGRIATPNEAEISLGGQRAVLSLNNVRYEAQGAEQLAQRPFLPYESEVLASRDDVAAFFRTAFGVELLPADPATTPPPAETPMPQEAPLDESAALLETDAIAAPRAADAAASPEGGTEETPAASDAAPADTGAYQAILIDAGHGGNDNGAQRPGGLNEKDVALAIAKRVAEALSGDQAFKVFLIRSEDQTLSLSERAALAQQQENAFLLSIHAGASFAPGASGVDIFYPAEYSRSRVSGNRERAAADVLAKALTDEGGASVRGLRRAPLKLFAQAGRPGCLVEVGCITNPEEEQLLGSEAFQERIARGLAAGIRALAGGN